MGGDNPPRLQAMVKESFDRVQALASEARELVSAGAEMIRCAVPEASSAKKVFPYLKNLGVPLIADCHFKKETVEASLKAGFNKIRLNPGNMSEKTLMESVKLAARTGAALRLGFNTGSSPARTPEELAGFALKWDEKLKKSGFMNFLVSLKSSSAKFTVEANRFFSVYSDTPLHIGVTAAGAGTGAIIKSAAGIASLLMDGVGDTLRVSLTSSSLEEIKCARIIRDVALDSASVLNVISCPGCSRCRMDVKRVSGKFRAGLSGSDMEKPLNVALMGCEVNGPGEAKESDIGVCATKKGALLIKKGKIIRALERDDIVKELIREMRKM